MGMMEAVEFIFKGNTNNQKVLLNIPNLEKGYDLFLFLVDVLCKGLVILYGLDGRVRVDQITPDQIAVIKQKLYNAGINLVINTTCDQSERRKLVPYILTPPGAINVEDYKLIIPSDGVKHEVQFNLMRTI
jgi:hypothetical protein